MVHRRRRLRLFGKEQLDAISRPRGYSAAEEVEILSPHRATQRQSTGNNWPVIGIPNFDASASGRFARAVERNGQFVNDRAYPVKDIHREVRIELSLRDESR